jgi:hypothetical protein
MALFPAGGVARRDGEVVWVMGLLWEREAAIMVSEMGEHMAETQNKSVLPKYKENKRNNLPDDARG